MKPLKRVKLIHLAVLALSLSAGSLMAQTTSTASGQTSSSTTDDMGQRKPIPPSKDAYGSGSVQGDKAMQSVGVKKQAFPPKAAGPTAQPKEANASRRPMSPTDAMETERMMKPIKINPNPPGTPAPEDTGDSSTESNDTDQKKFEDPMANHKDSKFMLDSDKTIKPIDDDKAQVPAGSDDSKKEKAWWQW